jgi:abhydrolase domain-containing protein 5
MIRKLWIPTSHTQLLNSQHNLLKYFVDSSSTLLKSHSIEVDENGNRMNVIEARSRRKVNKSPKESRTIVMCHGLGSGLGFFFHQFKDLLRGYDRVIAVDWLGFGGSDRPVCRSAPKLREKSWIPSFCQSKLQSVEDNVNFFIDPLQKCISKLINIEEQKYVLCGHSLGGYLTARYAIKYQNEISRLILLSPAGLPEIPSKTIRHGDLPMAMRLIDSAWSSNVTPGQIVRTMGYRGPTLVNRIVRGRFRSLGWNEEQIRVISEYLYHITAGMFSIFYPCFFLFILSIHSFTHPPTHPQLQDLVSFP